MDMARYLERQAYCPTVLHARHIKDRIQREDAGCVGMGWYETI